MVVALPSHGWDVNGSSPFLIHGQRGLLSPKSISSRFLETVKRWKTTAFLYFRKFWIVVLGSPRFEGIIYKHIHDVSIVHLVSIRSNLWCFRKGRGAVAEAMSGQRFPQIVQALSFDSTSLRLKMVLDGGQDKENWEWTEVVGSSTLLEKSQTKSTQKWQFTFLVCNA